MAGSGFIICKIIGDESKFLGLEGLEKWQQKSLGKYDIPKGTIEENESTWNGAVRECLEETGILVAPEDIIAGPMTSGFLTVWLVKTSQNPVIERNPITGKLEHLGYDWLSPENLSIDCFEFLYEFIKWGEKELIVKGSPYGKRI